MRALIEALALDEAAKPARKADMALGFLTLFSERDAFKSKHFSGYSRDITAQQAEEVAWELGYENEKYDKILKEYEAWARTIGADLKKAWSDGREAAG